jgi:hypothetical protein
MKNRQTLTIVFATLFVGFLLSIYFFKTQVKNNNNTVIIPTSNQNYLAFPYTLLDSHYKLNLSSERFRFFVEKYHYNEANIKNYSDSLQVVLMAELNDWQKARSAHLQITYTWQRVGQHIWQSEQQCEKLAKQIGIDQPFLFISYLKNSSNKNDQLYTMVYCQLRKQLLATLQDPSISDLPPDLLLKKAFANHPSILAMKQEVESKHQH